MRLVSYLVRTNTIYTVFSDGQMVAIAWGNRARMEKKAKFLALDSNVPCYDK